MSAATRQSRSRSAVVESRKYLEPPDFLWGHHPSAVRGNGFGTTPHRAASTSSTLPRTIEAAREGCISLPKQQGLCAISQLAPRVARRSEIVSTSATVAGRTHQAAIPRCARKPETASPTQTPSATRQSSPTMKFHQNAPKARTWLTRWLPRGARRAAGGEAGGRVRTTAGRGRQGWRGSRDPILASSRLLLRLPRRHRSS